MYTKLNDGINQARKNKGTDDFELRLEILSFLKAGILKDLIDKRMDRNTVPNSVVIQVAAKQIKQNLETLSFRHTDKLVAANEILKEFVPREVTKDEIIAIINDKKDFVKNKNQLIGIIINECKAKELTPNIELAKQCIEENF